VYWVVDGDERFVEVWAPDAEFPVVERERLVWVPTERRVRSRSSSGSCSGPSEAPGHTFGVG